MKKRSPYSAVLVVIMSLGLVVPADIAAQSAQRAGEVSRMVPQVRIVRGTQQINGVTSAPVDWGDLVNTQRAGRARIALDDGSVINVGSESSLKITQYTPGQQQTQMDLAYGKLRSKVAKITAPNGKFEVRTPVGVAGVVGTDFYLYFFNGMMQLIVFEGAVQFCNLAGVCVIVSGGMMSTIRDGNQPPETPSQATPMLLAEAGAGTETVAMGGAQAAAAASSLSPLAKLALVMLVVVPAVVIPVAVTHRGGRAAVGQIPRGPNDCQPGSNFCP